MPPRLLKPYGDPRLERELVGDIVEVYGLKAEQDTNQALNTALRQADYLMGDIDAAVTEEVLQAAPRLRAVICRSIGIDFVDVEAASRRSILVLNSPLFCVRAVAEYTLTIMLCVAHQIPKATHVMYRGDWAAREGLRGIEMKGKTLGLIGFGRIGQELAHMAQGIGMQVIAYDPYCAKKSANVQMLTLHQVLMQADVVSIHSPLTSQTRGMIGAQQLSWMKPGAILINVSRGGIVDEWALKKVLDSGKLYAAALDVLAREPAQPGDCFYQTEQDNLLLTPHAAWNTMEGHLRNQNTFRRQLISLLKGKIPEEGVVNPEVSQQWIDRWGE